MATVSDEDDDEGAVEQAAAATREPRESLVAQRMASDAPAADPGASASRTTGTMPAARRKSSSLPPAAAATGGIRDSGTMPAARRSRNRDPDSGLRPRSALGPVSLAAPTPEEVLFRLLTLTHAVSLEMREEEISLAYIDALRDLFPSRRFAVRLLGYDLHRDDPASELPRLSLVYATGRLLPHRRDHVAISREAMARHHLPDEAATTTGIAVVDEYEPLFEEGATGFDVPLVDGGAVTGVLAVEYPPGVGLGPGDPPILVPVALGLGAALRNARLLRESVYLRGYLERLLDNANAPILVIGPDRRVRVFNRAFEAMTGLGRAEVLGQDFLSLLPSEERSRVLPIYIKSLRGESTADVEVRLPRPRDETALVALSTAPILDADGEVHSVIAIGRDLSEVRSLQERIIQAEKFVTLGQLAAGVVHELNNPLTSISVYGDYLLKKATREGRDKGDVEKLGRVVAAAERMLNFTRDLLTYARPSSEEPTLLQLDQVVEEALMFCEHLLDEKGVAIERRYASGLGSVYAIRSQLHQVFINLVTNAVHAVSKENGKITVSTDAGPDASVIVRIHDNGEGIAPENLPMIFEPFFTTKPEGRGTGLGLSIVRNILRSHRAAVEVQSACAGGTTFQLTFLSKV
ncbi:MAG: PAS domain-containing protein [Deltaproteobacteria bacterium]|nr:PAS domain-containing protein [Deltaproteobacteria bacterium]